MTGYDFSDVLLVPFPFTDQAGVKQGPAVVVNYARYRRERHDLILMPITSQAQNSKRFGGVPILALRAPGRVGFASP